MRTNKQFASSISSINRDNFDKGSSIRTRIIIAMVLISFVTVSLTTALQIRMICQNILADTQMQAAALAMPIKQNIDSITNGGTGSEGFEQLAHTGPKVQMQRVLAETLSWPGRTDLMAAYVADANGKVLVAKGKTQTFIEVPSDVFESQVKGIERTRIVHNGSRYDTFVPYYWNGKQLAGYIVIGISAQSLWDQARSLASGAVISFLIVAVISVAFLALWVSRRLVTPLVRITRNIAQGAQDGNVRLGRMAKSGDEISRLAKVTDRVLPEMHRQQEQLRATSQQLTVENSKLERTKLALMEMERRYRSAVEAATGVAYELDLATGKFKFLSRQVYETVGFAAEDLPSSDVWAEHVHEEDRASAKEALSACVEGKKSCFSRKYRFICRDGHALEVAELGGVITDETGKVSGICGIIIPAHMLPKSLLVNN